MCVKFPLRPKICTEIDELVGSTPYFRLAHRFIPRGKKLILKLESFNPTFSVKDRTALGLVQAAFASGHLKPGGTVVESSSGNLGKSLAMLGANLGFRVIIVVDPKVSRQNLNCFRAFGAQVVMVDTPDERGSFQRARIEKVQAIVQEHPEFYWPNQYDNASNPRFHEMQTAFELRDLDFELLVGCVSTGGHLSGIARGVKRFHPDRKVLACDVAGSAVLGGPSHPYALNGVGLAWKSDNTDVEAFDATTVIADHLAVSMCRDLARSTGLLLGGSSGLCVAGALAALRSNAADRVMAVIPDTGANYLDQIYDDAWVEQKGLSLLEDSQLEASLDQLSIQWGARGPGVASA